MKANRVNTIGKRNRVYFFLNLIKCIPKIAIRFLNLLFHRKKLDCKDFRSDSSYCIDGTLNQLIWEVENTVFLTLSNSSKIFFNSGELLFHVSKAQQQFQLSAYGVGKKQKIRTQIKVVVLEKNDLTHVVTKSNNIVVDHNRTVNQSNISLRHIDNHSISFQKSLKPKFPKERKIRLQLSEFLDPSSTALFNTDSIEEVQQLKQLIDKNQEIS